MISLHRLQMATPPAKRYRKRSNVWTVFTKASINAAVCNLCQKEVRTCGNTSNLLSHIKRNHNDVLPEILVGEVASDALDNAVREIQLEPEVTIEENNTNDKPIDTQQTTKPNQLPKKKSDYNFAKPMRSKNSSMEIIKLNSTIEKINKSVDTWANTVDAKTSRVLQAAEKSQFYHGFEFLDTQFKKLPELKAQELMQKFMAMTYEAINQHEILNQPVYHVQLMPQDE